jgi:hypothetical protein
MKIDYKKNPDVMIEIGGLKSRLLLLIAVFFAKKIEIDSNRAFFAKEFILGLIETKNKIIPAYVPKEKGGFIEPTEVSDRIKKIFTE